MPVIRYNPQWDIIEFLDGFGYHEFESHTLEMQVKINILSTKEYSKTYHVNQAYDELVAKKDNNKAADNLSCQINMKHVDTGIVDPYQLFICSHIILQRDDREYVGK